MGGTVLTVRQTMYCTVRSVWLGQLRIQSSVHVGEIQLDIGDLCFRVFLFLLWLRPVSR